MSEPSPRSTIGPYRIVSRVGAGGMGEVFKAWDPRLERDVAIKLLHPEKATDPDRQKLLLAEGRAASALNHPNILRVYDADIDGASYYLVSEWLEGKSLRDELSRGALPLKRLLDLAVQIADGLTAAHAIGIVHRDIKPENVMLARDGTARIVDFGLSRLDPRAPGSVSSLGAASTITASLEGSISGTPAYMSPEQARGGLGDFRTDQFSFGALLYEMATGRSAFRRDSVADTLSAVLHDDVRPIAELNPRIPAACRWIIEQCLAKDAHERYAATEDLARELRRLRDRLLEAGADARAADAPVSRRRPARTLLVGTAALIAGVLIGWPWWPASSAPLRFTPFASASAYEGEPAWSADGQRVAYVADVDGVLQVFVRRIGDALSLQLTHTRFDAQRPFWAPDGQLLYFISLAGYGDALWSMGVAGGTPTLVLENVRAAAIDPTGQRLALIIEGDLWWSSPPGSSPTKEPHQPADAAGSVGTQLAFSPDGQLLVWSSGSAGMQATATAIERFYLYDRTAGSEPRRVLAHLTRTTNLSSFSWLPDSRRVLLSLADERLGSRHLWIADTRSESVEQVTSTHTNETTPAASPVDGRVAYATDEVDFDLVLLSADGRSRQPLLATARNEFAPVWSPSGDLFAFATDRSGELEIWTRSRDALWERPIVIASDFGASKTDAIGALAFSPDGKTLAYQRSSGGAFEVWLSPVTGGTPVRLINKAPGYVAFEDAPSWSPDGQWVSFSAITRFKEPNGNNTNTMRKVRVGTQEVIELSPSTAYTPTRWSPNGQWILVRTKEGLMRVAEDGSKSEVVVPDGVIDFTWAPDSRHVYALADSEKVGHFALIEVDSATGATKTINPDLGAIPVAVQPIRGFSYLPGQGFLTSLASARSDLWLLEGLQPAPGLFERFQAIFR